MNHNNIINKTLKTYLDKAIYLSINQEKSHAIDFLYLKILKSLGANIGKQFKAPTKEDLIKIIKEQFEVLLQTSEGKEIYQYYEEERVIKKLAKSYSLEEVKTYLKNIKSRFDFLSFIDECISAGNLSIIKMMVENPIKKSQIINVNYNYCYYAIEARQVELFDYFREKSKRGVKSHLTMFALSAIENDCTELLPKILALGKTNLNKILINALLHSTLEVQNFLVERGAKISQVKKFLTLKDEILKLESYRLNLSLKEEVKI